MTLCKNRRIHQLTISSVWAKNLQPLHVSVRFNRGGKGRLWPTYRHELSWPRQLRSKLDESSLLLTAISKDKAKKESDEGDDDIRPLFPHEVTQARSFVSGVLSRSRDFDVVLFTLLDLECEQFKKWELKNWILEPFLKELRVANSFSEIWFISISQ